MLLLGRHHLVRGGFANRTSHIGPGELVLRRSDAIRQSLSRHFLPLVSIQPPQESTSPGKREGQP